MDPINILVASIMTGQHNPFYGVYPLLPAISKAEHTTIHRMLMQNSRVDGRALLEKRDILVQEGNLPQAAGSAMATLESTTILVGIHASIVSDKISTESHCTWTLMIDHSDSSHSRLHGLLDKMLGLIPWDQTSLPANIWHFNIDMLILSDQSGGIEACSWAAILSALNSLKLPKMTVTSRSNQNGQVLLEQSEATIMPIHSSNDLSMPQFISFALFFSQQSICADPRPEEAHACDSMVHIGYIVPKKSIDPKEIQLLLLQTWPNLSLHNITEEHLPSENSLNDLYLSDWRYLIRNLKQVNQSMMGLSA
jgi:hypothetical protein